ncbi:adenosylcobinamide-GDP ribazoletransferase, partial [Pseudomonas sp.]
RGVVLVSAIACVLLAGSKAVLVLAVALVTFLYLRRQMVRRLGGTTGDTAGALLELLEMAALIAWAL